MTPVVEAKENILVRLDQAYQNLDRLPGDFSTETDTLNDAELLIRNIHKVLDGEEWDSDTPSDIAALLTDQGMVLRPVMDDCDMTAAELAEKYAGQDGSWGEHPEHHRRDWREEVQTDDTQLGYWDWVAARLAEEDKERGARLDSSRS